MPLPISTQREKISFWPCPLSILYGRAGVLCDGFAPRQGSSRREVERNPFLYFDYHDGTYSFHPLLASYLHYVFSRKSRRWQQAQQLRAARWYLQEGDYKQAIVLARRAGNYDTVLTAIEQGGRESLYGFAHDVAADTLQHASAAERAAHLEGCFYCVLYAFRCGKRLLAVKYLSVLADCVETEFADAAQRLYYVAYAEAMKGFCSYPDLSAMTKHVQRARELLPSPHDLILPWTFGSPSPLSLYHSLPGQLEQTAEGLRQFTASYIRLIHADVFPCQTDFIRGEYEYLTGRLDEAEQTLTQYVHANSIMPKCISHLQTAHFYLARLGPLPRRRRSAAERSTAPALAEAPGLPTMRHGCKPLVRTSSSVC